ncbi:MAG TPA: glutathione peroxidase [Candidatus Kapabacteria bacterium]|nr:glutathione peroxidase [Candidatus Kapabacteria bacterium]
MFSFFKVFLPTLILFASLGVFITYAELNKSDSIYNYKLKDIDGKIIDFNQYRGKTLLIVNVASYCGYTKQYAALEDLYIKYKSQGFEILAFPCNQFGQQEPGTNEEIKSFCTSNYKVNFTLFDKIEVNGNNQSPIYTFLKANQSNKEDIKWNFTKFLISKDGHNIQRFESKITPEQLDNTISNLINTK